MTEQFLRHAGRSLSTSLANRPVLIRHGLELLRRIASSFVVDDFLLGRQRAFYLTFDRESYLVIMKWCLDPCFMREHGFAQIQHER